MDHDQDLSSPDSPESLQIKQSPVRSPGSPQVFRGESSAPMILEPRDNSQAIGFLGKQPVYVMPVNHQDPFRSPYSSPPHHVVAETMRLTTPLVSPPPLSGICHIQIVEEPEEKFRFRYKSEMQGTHGCIHGRTYTKKSKKFPTIQIQNVPIDVQSVRVRVALYTNEKPRNHHVHKVMWKQSSDVEQNFVEFDVNRGQGFRHMWQGLGIIHTSRKYIDETLFNRIKKVFLEQKGAQVNIPNPQLTDAEELQLKSDAAAMGKKVTDKLNTVVLGFEAFRVDQGIYRPLCSMAFSNPINNLKNPSTGELKICRISAFAGSVNGGEEIFIFIERVKKGDIHVRFFELDKDEERVWEGFAEFQEGDVHHQYAIAFKTPAYKDLTTANDVGVFFELFRPSDNAFSEPKAFRYKPSEDVRLRKRARLNHFATRSQPLPVDSSPLVQSPYQKIEQIEIHDDEQTPINLTSIIDTLLKDEEYMEHLNEPSPYDHVQNMTSDIVPDLLVFSRPLLNMGMHEMNMGQMGTIASDSCMPESRPSASSDLSNDVLNTMTQAMYNLTTSNDKEQTRKQIRDSLMDVTNNEGNNIIHIAVVNHQTDALKLIIDMVDKVDVGDILDEPNRIGSSALHLAVETNQPEAVRMLLASKTYPNKLDRDGDTAVHIAIRENNMAILMTLLQHHADPNIPNHFGKFPLHIAVENNLLPVVKVLVDHGLDVDARDQVAGRTAIHLAVERQLEDMVYFLVKEAKVDLIREDYNGVTVAELAEGFKSMNIKKLLSKGLKKQI
eukprot:GFUD01048705.1.p1 GENE.GFUD01048705.1~~GFUD01048705.1.p1  ORF type:complete len:778 (-),score=189.68 GFUD01048705.1:74-2407(-)